MLLALKQLFSNFENESVRYVVWKSLENLDKQLEGLGDIDICILPEDQTAALSVLNKNAFLLDALSTATVGDDLLIFRGFDQESGRFIQLHIHFHCRFGSKRFKEYRYPYEHDMARDWYEDRGVRRLADGHFLATRVLMTFVKSSYDDGVTLDIVHCYDSLSPGDRTILDTVIRRYLAIEPPTLISHLRENNTAALKDLSKVCIARLDLEHRRTDFVSLAKRTRKKATLRWWLLTAAGRSRCKLRKPAEIVLTGPDGAGKSTVAKLLADKLAAIGGTQTVYLGRREWSLPNRLINRWRSHRHFNVVLNELWSFTSTAEILLRCLKGRILNWLGITVIYDRSIYDIQLKFMDQPHRTSSRLLCAVSRSLGARHGDLCYFMFAESPAAVARKAPGSCTAKEVDHARNKFEAILDDRFVSLDTTQLSAKKVADRIVADYFRSARHWSDRI